MVLETYYTDERMVNTMSHTKMVINLFGGPAIGKTTLASDIFSALKKFNIDAENVSEFPKELVLEGNLEALKHQWYVLANQTYRIHCAYRSMQVVIVDSPILLGPIYDPDNSKPLVDLCLEHHHRYNNLNIVLKRDAEKIHSMAGRIHSLTESISIDNRIVRLLEENGLPYIDYGAYGFERTMNIILRGIGHG